GAEHECGVTFGRLVGRTDGDSDAEWRGRPRAEPDLRQPTDLIDRARDEREVRPESAADPDPALGAEPEAVAADAGDHLTADRRGRVLEVTAELDVGVAEVERGLRRFHPGHPHR